jgi:hypothetical protein
LGWLDAEDVPVALDHILKEETNPATAERCDTANVRRKEMLNYELMRDKGILIVMPEGPLQVADFERLAQEADPYIEDHGKLNGLMVYAKSFPGWHDFAALRSHFRFVRNHHQHIKKVAAVTDSGLLSIMPRIASHFVQADIRRFPCHDKDAALNWLEGGNT